MESRKTRFVLQCRVVRAALLAFLAVQLAFFVLAWIVPDALAGNAFTVRVSPEGMSGDELLALPVALRIVGATLALPALLLLAYGLLQLDRMLRAFQRSAMFARATIAHLRAFAGATFLATLLSVLELPLRAAAYHLVQGGGQFRLAVGVSSEELLVALVCGVFYLLAAMMHEGRRLAEENEGFV